MVPHKVLAQLVRCHPLCGGNRDNEDEATKSRLPIHTFSQLMLLPGAEQCLDYPNECTRKCLLDYPTCYCRGAYEDALQTRHSGWPTEQLLGSAAKGQVASIPWNLGRSSS